MTEIQKTFILWTGLIRRSMAAFDGICLIMRNGKFETLQRMEIAG